MSDIISLDEWRKKAVKNSDSKSQSRLNSALEKLGVTPTESKDIEGYSIEHIVGFYIVLDKAWRKPFKLKGNFARQAALYVATCCSLGFITNQVDEDTFIDKFTITPMGMDYKDSLDEILDELAEEIDPDITH